MKKLAVIGCGVAALPILKKAKEMDVETYCFADDGIEEAMGLADNFIQTDFFEIDSVYKKCIEYGIDGIIATSEITTEVTAILANRLHLPGNRIENGFAGRNKYLMRERLTNTEGIFQPKFFLYTGKETISYPVVVKALDGCGKNGISLAKNKEEFEKAVNTAKSVSTNNQVLVEEYIESGIEYSVECLSCNDVHYVIQVTKKDTSGPPHFAEMGHHQPGEIKGTERYNLIEKSAKAILHAVGITSGMSHLEVKVTDDNKLYFIEVGARAGGDHIGDTLIDLSVDYDYYKGAINIALNEFTPPKVNFKAYSGIYFLSTQTEYLLPLFTLAQNASWCKKIKMPKNGIGNVVLNSQHEDGGYFIYQSDHKVSIADVKFVAERINDEEDTFNQLYDWNKKIGRNISDEELKIGIQKFIDKGNAIAIRNNSEVIAFLNVYCNDYETLNAYINNVEVYKSYRGLGLSKLLMEKAIELCVEKNFKTISLHVAKDNNAAIALYQKFGFKFVPSAEDNTQERLIEMVKKL